MTGRSRFSYWWFLCLPVQMALADEGAQLSYDCTAGDGSTRQITIEAHCSDERPPPGQDACRVEYTKDGKTEILWRARNDPSYCQPKVEDLVGKLEASGFSCTASGGPLCDDSIALAAPPPTDVTTSDPGRGSITITPSNQSSYRVQNTEIKKDYEIDHPTTVRAYLTFTRDARFGYFLAVLDSRLDRPTSDGTTPSASKEHAGSLEACLSNIDPNVTFEKLEEFIRQQFNSQSNTVRVVEHVHTFLDAECGLQKAPIVDVLETGQ